MEASPPQVSRIRLSHTEKVAGKKTFLQDLRKETLVVSVDQEKSEESFGKELCKPGPKQVWEEQYEKQAEEERPPHAGRDQKRDCYNNRED